MYIVNMNRLKKIFFFSFLLYCSLVQGADGAFAQMKYENKKADSYFENNEFAKAIPLYKRDAAKNDEALKKLADCYRIIKNYTEAEACYGKLAAKNSADPMVYYYYGESLLNNNKYEEAKKQFLLYSTLNPTDKKGELYAKACDDMKEILVKPALYKAYNLGSVNSAVSDFCPVFYRDGIVFASERIRDLVNYSENNYTGNGYLSLVFAKTHVRSIPVSKDTSSKAVSDTAQRTSKDTAIYNSAVLFSENFTGDGHFGPACFNGDYSEIYFTKVDNSESLKRGEVSRPKLYWSKHGNGWSAPKELPFDNKDFVTAHPSISKDGQQLYFSSNMPGGEGGTDLWVSKREGDGWGTPQNLGPGVNTAGDEEFPYISPNNILYFSSNGHAGFGGLDLFASVQKDGQWEKPNNMMPPVNSSGDDFGIIFKDDNSGYFSSNRKGGKGSDDLYGFALSGMITSISGKILLSNKTDDGAQNLKVFLLTDNGTILQTTTTDGSGFFHFENLNSDHSYMVRVDESDPSLINQKKFYLTDAKNKIVRVIVRGKNGVFVFENLPPDLSKLSEINEADETLKNFSIAGNMYVGDQRAPLENAKVNLVNDKGETVQSTTTNAFGSFVFMNISPDENFTVTLDDADPKLAGKKIYFTNKSGKEIAAGQAGSFKFQILASDASTLSLLKVEDSDLLIDLKGALYGDAEGKTRIGNASISLVDDKGNVTGASKTDDKGNFKFANLAADKNYMVRLKEDDQALLNRDVYLANGSGKIVATLKSANGKFFRYTFLPMEEQSLVSIYFDDPWLQVAKANSDAYKDSARNIVENIYYDYQKWDLLPQAIITLDKVVQAMKANKDLAIEVLSNTDCRGADDYNMKLSQKRAQAAVNYIISKGIKKDRLTAIGLGETKPLNHCTEGVACSEEEYARNRRTEFNVKSKAK
jgi:outer membrane protein OmpA-like peptidoglycan-associated protein